MSGDFNDFGSTFSYALKSAEPQKLMVENDVAACITNFAERVNILREQFYKL